MVAGCRGLVGFEEEKEEEGWVSAVNDTTAWGHHPADPTPPLFTKLDRNHLHDDCACVFK